LRSARLPQLQEQFGVQCLLVAIQLFGKFPDFRKNLMAAARHAVARHDFCQGMRQIGVLFHMRLKVTTRAEKLHGILLIAEVGFGGMPKLVKQLPKQFRAIAIQLAGRIQIGSGCANRVGAACLKAADAAQDDRELFHASLHVQTGCIVMTMQYRIP
jgi:hypothetical protein